MSGHKRATISLSDLENARFHDLENRLRIVEKDYGNVLKSVKEDQAFELNNLFVQFQSEEQEFHDEIAQSLQGSSDDLLKGMADLQEGFHTTLTSQSDNIKHQMMDLEMDIYSITSEMVAGYGSQLMQTLEEFTSSRDAEIFQFINHVSANEDQKYKIALETYQSAQQLFDFVVKQYPVFQYYPDIEDPYQMKFELCRQNIEDGFFEAGLITAQHIIQDVEKIRLEIKEKEFRRQFLFIETVRAAYATDAMVKNNQQVNAIGIDQEELGIKIDVQFWSDQRYGEIVSKVQSLIKRIDESNNFLSEEALIEIYDDLLPRIRAELENCVYWARRNILSSQIRFNIASSVIKALGVQGFRLTHGGYLDGDQRGVYQVHLQHIDGSEVIVEVKAKDEDICSTQLDLESLDAKVRSEHELRQRALEMARSLQQFGLNIRKNTIGEPNSDYLNPENTQPSSEKIIKEQRVGYGRH